jgi:hypothetical protein
MREIFDVMFVACLMLPPAALFAGAVALVWPRHVRTTAAPAAQPAHA